MSKTLIFILFTIVTLSFIYIVNGAVVMGIDFGSDSIKVAVIKGSSFEVVINKESKRKTLNAVGFTKLGERVFGNRAESLVNINLNYEFSSIFIIKYFIKKQILTIY
jgi:molecular chaperone DnaK (HSP70)